MPGSPLKIIVDEDADMHLPAPSMEDVRRDAKRAPYVRRRIQAPVETADSIAPLATASPAQRLQELLPHLHAYSTRARCDDIPSDLVRECIWAVEIQLRCWQEDPKKLLQPTVMFVLRLGKLYMRPDVELANRAVHHMSGLFSTLHLADRSWDLSLFPLKINFMYAVALAKVGVDDDQAETILTRFLAADHPHAFVKTSRIVAELYLSRVLRRKGRVQEASAIESELVRWFRRNPHVFPDSKLGSIFLSGPDEDQTDPVLTALGGRSWLHNRQKTVKSEERRMRFCLRCNRQDSGVALKMCGACKNAWYCSARCQKADWPFHKELCKWRVECNKYATSLEPKDGTSDGLRQELHAWSKWDMMNNSHVPVHALGLQRDFTRGRTHVLYRKVDHEPAANSVSKQFVTRAFGTFRLNEVLDNVDFEKGTGREIFRKIFQPFESGKVSDIVPMVEIVSCRQGGLIVVLKTLPRKEISEVPYDPHWIQRVSHHGQDVPVKILQWSGAKNAEHDF